MSILTPSPFFFNFHRLLSEKYLFLLPPHFFSHPTDCCRKKTCSSSTTYFFTSHRLLSEKKMCLSLVPPQVAVGNFLFLSHRLLSEKPSSSGPSTVCCRKKNLFVSLFSPADCCRNFSASGAPPTVEVIKLFFLIFFCSNFCFVFNFFSFKLFLVLIFFSIFFWF